jgi:hypothetical protein
MAITQKSSKKLALVISKSLIDEEFIIPMISQAMSKGDERNIYKLSEENHDFPKGVNTILAACVSPTCSDQGCYSISCPKKLDKLFTDYIESPVKISNLQKVNDTFSKCLESRIMAFKCSTARAKRNI